MPGIFDAVPDLKELVAKDQGIQDARQALGDTLKGALLGATTDAIGGLVDPINPKSPLSSNSLREVLGQSPQENDSPDTKLSSLLSGPAAGLLKGSAKTLLPMLLGVFTGPKSKTWSPMAAEMFKALESSPGVKPDAFNRLFQQEGIFRSPGDKQLRQEIKDTGSQFATEIANKIKPGQSQQFQLQDIFSHPKLFEAYPELKQLPVELFNAPGHTVNGSFNPIWGATLNTAGQNPHSTLLHELQHAIQHKEGFARGGNPAEFNTKNIEGLAIANGLRANGVEPTQEMVATILYNRLSGEAEARAVQRRLADALSPAPTQNLYSKSPETGAGYDIALRNLINKFHETFQK